MFRVRNIYTIFLVSVLFILLNSPHISAQELLPHPAIVNSPDRYIDLNKINENIEKHRKSGCTTCWSRLMVSTF